MSFAGNLSTVSFGDNLQLISTGKKTGALLLIRGTQKKHIYFRDGQVVFASSDHAEEDRLGQLLIRQGRITPEQLQSVLDSQKVTRKRLGELIIEMHLVEAPQIAEALRLQVEEIIYSIFVWGDGEFQFVDGEEPPPNSPVITIDTMSVMMEGARRFDEWNRIRESLPPAEAVLQIRSVPMMTGEEINLAPEDIEMLALINGYRRMDEIVQKSARGEYAAACSMHKLITEGLIEPIERDGQETGGPDEWRNLYDLVFKLYSHSLQRIYRELTDVLGEGGERLFARPVGKKVMNGLFDSLISGETPSAKEDFQHVAASIPENMRLHKVLSQATILLQSRLNLVRNLLGDRVASRLVDGIQKDVAFLLAQKRSLADKYDIGREFANSLDGS